MQNRGLLLGSEEVVNQDIQEVLNPATRAVVGTFPMASADAVDNAVRICTQAQPAWGRKSIDSRSAVLSSAAALIDTHAQEIAQVLTLEQGKPIADAVKEVRFSAEVFRYYARNTEVLSEQQRRTVSQGIHSLVRRAPIGVVAGIVPWNYPVDLWAWKVAPALIAGNAIVMKPPIESPLAAGMVARLLYEAGLPDGVLCDIPGGIEAGRAIASHPEIDAISATCSTAAGVSIMRDAAATMKRLTLELGGNCPLVVLDDADIRLAAAAATRRSFSNTGQICIAVNRIIVQGGVADEFAAAMVDAVNQIRVGDGMHPDVTMGPATTDAVRVKARSHIDDALSRGAQVLPTAQLDEEIANSSGFFMAPAVLDHVPEAALIAREETFGPAVGILRVDSDAEALRIANDSIYGLAAYVYTSDEQRGQRFARELEYGGVGVNVNDVTELDAPFGGWKMSGFGRDLGPEGLIAMTEMQHIRSQRRPG